MTRIHVCRASELAPLQTRVVSMTPDPEGRPREALILRDGEGVVRAYVNRCKHLPIPLDSGSREFFDANRQHLLCRTHGAVYRTDTGRCIDGPCKGTFLDPLTCIEKNEDIFVEY